MPAPNEIVQALAWLQDCGRLDEILAPFLPPKVDTWQECECLDTRGPDDNEPTNAKYTAVGPWQPYAAWPGTRCWRRPLRLVLTPTPTEL